AEKRQARYDAYVAGVRSVDDSGLEVERWARDEDLRKDKYAFRTAEEIREAVEDAMAIDPRVFSMNVDTSVSAGVVTLRGVVDNLKAKRAAEADARNTVGVRSVRNHLKVRPIEDRSDVAIESDVLAALRRDPFVERYEITVNAYDGAVYLSGMVDSYFEKSQADDLASRTPGVTRVVNSLVVDDRPYAYDPYVDPWYMYGYPWYGHEPYYTLDSDWEIKNDIEDELFWSPFVDADQVTVTVDDGVATLTGTVDSWTEKGAARDNAFDGGATRVRNELVVDTGDAAASGQ
ncbi:MAG: BON domain-containing protein, partial [Acidobacteriota bacterium]|nr:BON domain-containing protein [Acidobacteriota bacterium]